MKQRKVFLYWVLFISLILSGMVYGGFLGLYQKINQLDSSHISFVIIAVFLLASAWSGCLYWRLSGSIESITNDKVLDSNGYEGGAERRIRGFFIYAAHVSFAAEVCQLLGFLGTIHGMMLFILGPLGSLINIKEVSELGRIFSEGIPDLGTALLTTYVGIVASILLGLQNHTFKYLLRKLENGLRS